MFFTEYQKHSNLLSKKGFRMNSNENEIIDLQQYEVQEKLAKGLECKYYLIVNIQTGKKFLVKSLIKPFKDLTRNNVISFSRELRVLSKINHPSFLKFTGYSLKNTKGKPKGLVVMEYPQKWALDCFLGDQPKSSLNITQKLIIIYGIAAGMSYLHSNNVLHRNFTIWSIYLDDYFHPKIFGLDQSIELSKSEEIFIETFPKRFTEFVSPESFLNCEYSKSSDVYSFALIMYALITNNGFSDDINFIEDVGKKGKRPNLDEKIPKCFRLLIEKCWSQNPKERPTFDEIVLELKSNDEFSNFDDFNKEEFQNYQKFIDESPKSFQTDKKFEEVDELIKEKSHLFNKNEFIEKRLKYSNTESYLNLDNYEIDKYDDVIHKITKTSFKRFNLKKIGDYLRSEISNIAKTINIMAQLDHPLIIKFSGYSNVNFNNEPKGFILTNFQMGNGYYKLDSKNVLITIYGIAYGMAYLHSHNILHRDLKPENIKCDKFGIPTIIGLDIAKEIKEEDVKPNKKIKGTPAYIAPEVYLHQGYSKASDVYSFALIMYEIFTDERPFIEMKSANEIKQFICEDQKRPTFERPIPQKYRELIESCWSQNAKDRPTFESILQSLKTDPSYITDDIDKEDFYDFVECLEEFPTKFDPNNRIKLFDDILTSKLHTFLDIRPNFPLNNLYETEMNDISLIREYINIEDIKHLERIKKSEFYAVDTASNNRTGMIYLQKSTNKSLLDFYRNEIINFSRELNILLQLNHPCILKFYGYANSNFDNHMNIFCEYLKKGSLRDVLKTMKKTENNTSKMIIIYGIACGMMYLHSHNILHRDLKLENIYLDDSLYPKISGFRIAKEIKEEDVKPNEKIKGTPAYIAPEVYMHQGYSKASDVYSFALIMYEIFTDERPFIEMKSVNEIKQFICEDQKRPTFERPIPQKYRELIESCWSQNAKDRPTFEHIVHSLKTDPSYITDDIDKEEFLKYINIIDSSLITFESSKRINHLEEYVHFKLHNFESYDVKFNRRNVFETEANNVSFDLESINLNSIEKQKLIQRNKCFKFHQVLDMNTGQVYISKQALFNARTAILVNATNEIFSEIEIISELNHKSILKFIGYSCVDFKGRERPVILTENASNGSLKRILEFEQTNESKILDDTKKLILIYGIASGMKYLHSKNIIHNNLNLFNIFLDEFLFPKIAGLNQYKITSENFAYNAPKFLKSDIQSNDDNEAEGDALFNKLFLKYSIEKYLLTIDYDIHKAPELMKSKTNHPSQDVYSFGMILYRLITGQIPFSKETLNTEDFLDIYLEGLRPEFPESTPDCYRKLIEKCWLTDPRERPSFDEIVYHLRTNPEFINEKVNKEEFQNYVDFVDEKQNESARIDDFIQTQNQLFRKVKIDFSKLRDQKKLYFSVDIGTIDINYFEKQLKIGSGSFGSVYQVVDKRDDNDYAAKISIYEMDQCPEDTIINMSREIDIISNLDHPCIFKFIGYSPTDFSNIKKPVIITEFASNGSLDKILDMERNGLSISGWDDTTKLINIYGIAAGMCHLHEHKILHRDLKPANILVDEFLHPKIADFGLSKSIDDEKTEGKKVVGSGFKGTFAYCAPEVIFEQHYSKEGDVYAFGMIVYEIMTNELIFPGFNQYQLLVALTNNVRPKFRYPIPYCYKKLIKKCWSSNTRERPSFLQIIKLLETDPSFITQNVSKEDFLDYVSLIKESQNEESSIGTQSTENDSSTKKFKKVTLNKIQDNQEEKDENFLDLTKYERKSVINKSDTFKIYKIKERETGNNFCAQISMIKSGFLSNDIKNNLVNEIKILLKMNHPSLLKFVGFSPTDFKNKPKPVVVTEPFTNGTLDEILEIERNGTEILGWNDTKKLFNIYGIASGISYLHSHNVIHRCLDPKNVFLDDSLLPKIGYFGLSTQFLSQDSMTHQSMTGMKCKPIYAAPEVLQSNEYTKKGDVYSFAFIVYEIITGEKPFCEIENMNDVLDKIINQDKRPTLKESIPMSYKKLIERCWSQEQSERPSFEEICYFLEMDSGFITDKIDNENYQKYIKFIGEQTLSIKIDSPLKVKEIVEEENKDQNVLFHQMQAELGNVESQEFLAKKYSLENDCENINKYFNMLIKQGKCDIPIEYAVHLYKEKHYEQAFNYFCLINKVNHPIAQFYIAVMKYWGNGCQKNQNESYNILKYLSDNGIERATEFLENHFEI